MHRIYRYITIVLIVTLLPTVADAQAFNHVHLPSKMCGGDTLTFTFGFNPMFDVFVNNQQSTLNHPGKVFLPDGEPCGENGCSYRSPVTFTDFSNGATISSIQDLKYVKLNIEHSYIGDLYINITCPNGQKADLMRFGGQNDSGCRDAIPSSAIGWLSGSNMALGNHFGLPVDQENTSDLCDSSAVGNEPGIGWNYCWSDNTTSGYVYASGDGVIYRSGHATGGHVDSSNVAAGTNFFHPDESFNSLIGCPLNGSWYIEVVDGFAQDNGYIFDWEMALEETLLPSTCVIVDRYVNSPYVQTINDSTYRLMIPSSVNDTAIDIVLAIVSSCGDTIDTTVTISLGHAYLGVESDTVVENELPVTFNGIAFNNDVDTVFSYNTESGCDSVLFYHLKVWHNVVINHDTVLCDNKMPAFWRGVLFRTAGSVTFNYSTIHGADSSIVLTMNNRHAYDTTFADTTCSNMPYFVGWHLCDTTGIHNVTLYTIDGCDSVIHLDLTINPAYDIQFKEQACSRDGYTFGGEHYTNSGTYSNSYTTVDGCDSLVSLTLEMVATDLTAHADVAPRIVRPESPDVRLTDVSFGAASRKWEVGGATSTESTWLLRYPIERDSLPVNLIAISKEGCTDTFTCTVFIDRSAFYAPNAFTPDREDNNRWWPLTTDVVEMYLYIYDRNGNLIYSHEGIDGSWDGTYNGAPCPQGVYVYLARYRTNFRPARPHIEKGAITLIR